MSAEPEITAPRIETERLALEWMTLDDAPLMLAVWNDGAFMRFVGDRGVRTLEQAQEALRNGPLSLYEKFGYGPFRVTVRDEGVDIGVCGLYRREGIEDPDIGFALLPDYCGKGYGYEAAAAVVDYAREDLELERLIAIVSPANATSIGLIEKLGLRYERDVRIAGDDHDVRVYGMQLNG